MLAALFCDSLLFFKRCFRARLVAAAFKKYIYCNGTGKVDCIYFFHGRMGLYLFS